MYDDLLSVMCYQTRSHGDHILIDWLADQGWYGGFQYNNFGVIANASDTYQVWSGDVTEPLCTFYYEATAMSKNIYTIKGKGPYTWT